MVCSGIGELRSVSVVENSVALYDERTDGTDVRAAPTAKSTDRGNEEKAISIQMETLINLDAAQVGLTPLTSRRSHSAR